MVQRPRRLQCPRLRIDVKVSANLFGVKKKSSRRVAAAEAHAAQRGVKAGILRDREAVDPLLKERRQLGGPVRGRRGVDDVDEHIGGDGTRVTVRIRGGHLELEES